MNVRTVVILSACCVTLLMQAPPALCATPDIQTGEAPTHSTAALPDVARDSSTSDGHPLDRADLEAWLDGVVPYMLKAGDIAGAVVVVVKDGAVLLQKGYGYRDVGTKHPIDPVHTMVRIGSTTKLFTWTAIMQLVEQGKLDLDRDVNDYLDFKISRDFGKPVTLRDLMNHRGGFEEGLKDILRTDPRDLPSTEAYLKDHQRPMLFAPGVVPAYSNYGTALAGYIVERVSGEPYERYIERHILAPLGMEHTTFDQPLPERFASAVSKGYRTASAPPEPYEEIVTRPAGSATTTAADMSRFMIAHLQQGHLGDARILLPDTARVMHSPSQPALPGFATMAHGFIRETHNGRLTIGHGGDTVLFHTELELLPKEGAGILYTFNSRGRDNAVYFAREALFGGFMDRYFPDIAAPADVPALPSAPADAREIAGRYESSRRVEHGFISIFYVLQQSMISANPDGTISAPSFPDTEPVTFKEIGPQLWRRVGGSQQLALQTIGGLKTVIDSTDPTSVLQSVPWRRSASLNLTVLLGSLLVLASTLLLWLLSPFLKPSTGIAPDIVPSVRRLRLLLRCAVAFDVMYLTAWFMLLRPLLATDLQVYRSSLDPVVRALQFAGPLAIAAAALGIWSAWRLSWLNVPRSSRIWACIVAAGLLGVVWIGFIGGLFRFSVNY